MLPKHFLNTGQKERIGFECAFPSYGNAGYLLGYRIGESYTD
jgi:hypothetical protein